MISYFRLKGLGVMPGFALNSLRVERQLLRSDGLIGHSSGARLGGLEFWSVTVWRDEPALMDFVRAHPHARIMEAMRPAVVRSEFVRWRVNGASVPPTPQEAESRLRRRLAA
jgi:heme-degrading monooxygenase HmoA